MALLRKILFPFAAIYGSITGLRNYFYDSGIFRSASFDVPVIAVGNLSVGGTGKSPMIEYLVGLLSKKFELATLSRGYKRKTSGFVLADGTSTAETIGDEPMQFHEVFPDIQVAVDANRTEGIEKLLSTSTPPQVILLDDAFQHRKVKAGFYILLTAYGDLYVDDFLLPTGNLREGRRGAKRADVIVITKCPRDLSAAEQNRFRMKMRLKPHQQLYFSFIDYSAEIKSKKQVENVGEIRQADKVLLAGIAKPKPFFDHLKNDSDTLLEFPDHHNFSENELTDILKKAAGRPIVTTQKDYMRLQDSVLADSLFYLPIQTAFVSDAENFNKTILDYVGKSSANR